MAKLTPNRMALGAIILVYLALAVGYNLVTPAGSRDQHNPDENDHVLYLQVLSTGHLPVFRGAEQGSEYHQPPLYYLIATPVYMLAGGHIRPGPDGSFADDAVAIHWVRFVSTLIGALLIVAAYRCARTMLLDEPAAALLVAGLVAFVPMNVAMNASVGNDCLTNLLVATGLAVMARISTLTPYPSPGDARSSLGRGELITDDGTGALERSRPASRLTSVCGGKDPIVLGVILGLIILTKSSALVLFPAVLALWGWLGYRKALTGVAALRGAAISIGLGLLIGSPWLIRNAVLYGDPLGQKLFMRSFPATAQADGMIQYLAHQSPGADSTIGFGRYLNVVKDWTFASFWGVFDSMRAFWGRDVLDMSPSIKAPLAPIYDVLILACVIALAGLCLYFRRWKPDIRQSAMLVAFVVLIFGTWYGFTMFIFKFFQAQGRYWFTSLVPLAIFFALGYRGLLPRPKWYAAGVAAMLVGLVALNVYTLVALLWPRFSP